jgi:DHA2 family multidrug resistance protein
LDKGERDDWFGSPFILWLTVVAVLALIGLIAWELTIRHPVIDPRLLQERNFCVSTFMIFILGIIFYGTTVLLPFLPQTLMGYTAMQRGLSTLSGRNGSAHSDAVVGWTPNRAESRCLVAFGFAFAAFGLTQLAQLSLVVGQRTPVIDWIISRAAMAFLWGAHERNGVLFRAPRQNEQRHRP